MRHPDLTHAQVESTLTTMRKRASQSNQRFVALTDEEAAQELTTGETPPSPNNNFGQTDPDEEHSDEVMFDEEGENVVVTPILPSYKFLSKAMSSKSAFDFGSSSLALESESTPKLHDDVVTKPGPSNYPVNPDHNHSNDSTSSLAGKHIDPFSLLDIQANVFDTMKKVDTIEAYVSGINSMLDEKFSGLDSKLDVILHSL